MISPAGHRLVGCSAGPHWGTREEWLSLSAPVFTRNETIITDLDLGAAVLDVVLSRACRVQVVVDDPGLGIDEVRFVDGSGSKVLFYRHGSAVVNWMRCTEVVGGRIQMLVVSDSAVSAEFWGGGERVATVPVALGGDAVTVIFP